MTTRVLLVGEGPFAETLAGRFVDHGCRVRLAGGAAQAAEAVKADAFDVALADAGLGAEISAWAAKGGGPRFILAAGGRLGDSLHVVHRAMEPKDYLDLSVGAGRNGGTLLMDERVDPTCHITRLMESAGHRVLRIGGDGLAAAAEGQQVVDLAFLDAGLSGWEAWRRLKAAGRGTRAVMPAGPCGDHVAARFAKGESPVIGKILSTSDMDGLVGACLKAVPRAAASLLLVDDDEPFRESLGDFLRGEGFQVDEAGTAAQSLERTAGKAYDVIVSDYHLPDLSGVQMIERLADQGVKSKIILLTGEPDLDSAIQSLRMRVQAYFQKPVDPQSLLSALEQGLRDKRMEGQVKELLQELNRANGKLEAFDHMKSRFLYLVAHDIRSPLSAARGFTDYILMQNPVLAPGIKSGLDVIGQALDQVNRLVEDIMDLGRMESGKLSVKPEPVDIRAMSDGWKARFELLARKEEVTLEFSGEGAPSEITADPMRLEQVVGNLVGNAIKHSGGGRRVSVVLSGTDGGGLAIDIKDDGPGLKADELSRVFEPFYQGDDPVALKKGIGLGLAIVRELVDAHGGRVWAESEGPGKGCTFRVRLPRTPPEKKTP